MDPLAFLVVTVILVALAFDFINGWNDSANAIATVISTKVLSPGKAILLAATLNLAGAFAGQAVAKTIAYKIIDPVVFDPLPETTKQLCILAAVVAAALWVAFVTRLGMPVSGSHSLIGGLIGAGLGISGTSAIKVAGIEKVVLALLLSPVFGLILGFVLMLGLYWLCKRWSQSRVQATFGRLQLVSVSFMAYTHGKNDAQKAMGVITLGLVAAGWQDDRGIQWWVIVLCGLAMAFGTAAGGWRVIKTVGGGLLKLRPVQGFAAETAAGVVLETAANMGLPVSTTHTITSTIMGVGATQRLSAVRWGVGKKIVGAWIFTFPATIGVGWFAFKLFDAIF